MSCSTFVVFVLTQEKPLTTDIVFPALTLFNLLTFPLTILPMVITAIVEATVAVNRLTEYLNSDELQSNAVTRKPAAEKRGEEAVCISNGSFSWNRYEESEALSRIQLSARKGDLTCIVGRVGSGKSSLLEAILGNLYKTGGEVTLRGSVAYVAQSTWVMNASVKENILFGHRWDSSFYEQTINACALLEDFSSLPDGDKTEVGERGISLSGGQKARLTLARAVYARADVYLLDDVLSAVDGHVGRHIINNVLGPKGLLSGKTRILATNSIPVLAESDAIHMIKDGKIVESGSFDHLMSIKDGAVAELVRGAPDEEEVSEGSSTSSELGVLEKEEQEQEQVVDDQDDIQDEQIQDIQEGATHLAPIRPPLRSTSRQTSMLTLRRASTVSFHGSLGKAASEDEGSAVRTKQSEEGAEQGKVKWSVYSEYAKQSNLIAVGVYLITLFAAQTAQIGESTAS